jgi:hypothetical protein
MHDDSTVNPVMEEVVEYAATDRPRRFRAMSAPVAATAFAVTLAFMLLFPFVRISLEGSGEPATLLFLTKTDFGLNIFALVLLLMPIAGIAASLVLRESAALLADAAGDPHARSRRRRQCIVGIARRARRRSDHRVGDAAHHRDNLWNRRNAGATVELRRCK